MKNWPVRGGSPPRAIHRAKCFKHLPSRRRSRELHSSPDQQKWTQTTAAMIRGKPRFSNHTGLLGPTMPAGCSAAAMFCSTPA